MYTANQNPEQLVRDQIDKMLFTFGWVVQSKKQINLAPGKGVAVREYQTNVGPADYLLFVNQKPAGIIEAKREEEGLPTPIANVPLKTIVDFKRKREQYLLHFKKHLSDFRVKIAKSKLQAELKEIAITFQEGLISGVQDLKAVLKDSKIESGFKSFKSLINLKSSTVFASAGTLLNMNFDLINLPPDLTGIGLAAVGAIELTGNYIELRNKQRAKEKESAFSYIYKAQKFEILKRY